MALLEHTGRRPLFVDPGEVVSVLGPPGSGKTRLGLELAFLIRPEDGQVLFHGKNPIARRGSSNRPREVTMLVQNAEDQLFAGNVFDDVAFGPRHLDLDESEIERRVLKALSVVRLDPETVRGRSPFALSGGERRRVALAGVLAMEPEVLILDEPTSNLDPQTRDQFVDLLEPMRGRGAIVWLTASAAEAAVADRVYLLRDGAVEDIGPGDRILHDWRRLASAGVELPAVYELAGTLEQRGARLPEVDSSAALAGAIVGEWKRRHDDR